MEKKAYEALQKMAEDYQLHQAVDRPTRGDNILDLIYTSSPTSLNNCETQIMKPISDHNLVKIKYQCDSKNKEKNNQNYMKEIYQHEISKFNFEEAEDEQVLEQIKAIPWDKRIHRDVKTITSHT